MSKEWKEEIIRLLDRLFWVASGFGLCWMWFK